MTRNLVLVAALGIAWGLNWPAVRLALGELSPWTLRAVGFTAASGLMFLGMAVRGIVPRVPREHWLRLAGVGALSIIGYNLLSAFSQLTASTSRSAVLSYTMPIWTVVFARIVLGEPIDRRRGLGLALGSAGLLALGLPILRAGEFSRGLVFALLSGVVWAVGNVALKRWPIRTTPLIMTAWQLLLGAVVTWVGAIVVEGLPHALPVRAETWAGLLYNVIIGQAIATTLWFTILDRMPTGIASVGSLLVPGIGVVGAALILGERPDLSDWLGLVLIVAAAATVLIRKPPREDVAPAITAATLRSPVPAKIS